MMFLRHFLLALQFFTRIPVTGALADWVGYSPAMLRASAAHFPGIGWLVGAWAAALSAGLFVVLPASPMTPLVVAVLGTVASVLLMTLAYALFLLRTVEKVDDLVYFLLFGLVK